MSKSKDNDFLIHYGTPRHSGRYPWGSGKKPQRSRDFYSRYRQLIKDGFSQKEIADMEGMSTTELRKQITLARAEVDRADIIQVTRLHEKGMSNVAIAKRMGHDDKWVRNKLKQADDNGNTKSSTIDKTTDILRSAVDDSKYIDVSKGVSKYVGVSDSVFKASVKQLVDSGEYEKVTMRIKQLTTGQYTNTDVLVPAGTTTKEIYDHISEIELPVTYIVDRDPDTTHKIHQPINISSDRVMIRSAEEGGRDRDGTMEIRRGVQDLDMGNAHYAQVRVGVDGTHYLKGVAVYGKDSDFPPGVDIIVNSNKAKSLPKLDHLKKQNTDKDGNVDRDNPFSASISRQNDWTDADGKVHEGALNIIREEGEWGSWKKTLAAQFLSKQPLELAKQQLDQGTKDKRAEFDDLKSVTNPVLKQKLLEDFGDGCDADAVDLKAAALPRQSSHLLLPVPNMKDNEVYAPNYENGEEVILIRYPHGGTFEIPRLKVNNKSKYAKDLMGDNPIDAIGINPKVAEQLSGADFDGDTVMVIPTRGIHVKTSPMLEGLKDFDTKMYKVDPDNPPAGFKRMGRKYGGPDKGTEMGKITNLITDMSLQDAPEEDLLRAVRHSMVIIDSEKHCLDYKKSYDDNDIAGLKEKYRGGSNAGASTLLSRAGRQAQESKQASYSGKIDPETGKRTIVEAPEYYQETKKVPRVDSSGNPVLNEKGRQIVDYIPLFNKDGTPKIKERTVQTTEMAKAKTKEDVYALSSGHPMETLYADFAWSMKSLGNEARKESANVEIPKWTKGNQATKTYAPEVESLKKKLDEVVMNAPLERKAQALAGVRYREKLDANPEMAYDAEEKKKVRNWAVRTAREDVGAKGVEIEISNKEWEAIQAGAVSPTMQRRIFNKANQDQLMELALPKRDSGFTRSQETKILAMLDRGYTTAEVADRFGVSTSVISGVKKGSE